MLQQHSRRTRILIPVIGACVLIQAESRAQDFNGDGFADVAVGCPGEATANLDNSGAVVVIYGKATGLTAGAAAVLPAHLLHQLVGWMPGNVQQGDRFGQALAWGDFNADGKDDLAIGIPHEHEDIAEDTSGVGAVIVIYGTANGLTGGGPIAPQWWHQDVGAIPDTAQSSDFFGGALAAGDFNGDGKDDLAIGVPGECFDDVNFTDDNAGAVHVLYGTAGGLSDAGSIIWSQTLIGGGTVSEINDGFGLVLETGNFNNDSYDDLAIGAPLENLSDLVSDSGEIDVLYGNQWGLGAGGNAQIWTESSALVGVGAQSNDVFGSAIAAGDFDGDGDDDIAMAAPGRGIGVNAMTGRIYILKSNPQQGIGGQGGMADDWHLDKPGVPSSNAPNRRAGEALEAGDFNGDQCDDLVIGVPFDAVGAMAQAGSAVVIYGGPAALTARLQDGAVIAAQHWHQNRANMPGVAAMADTFGWPLHAADFNNDSIDDLCIGAPSDAVGAFDGGTVSVVYGGPTPFGLAAGGGPIEAQIWHQNRPGVPEAADAGDGFGAAIAKR